MKSKPKKEENRRNRIKGFKRFSKRAKIFKNKARIYRKITWAFLHKLNNAHKAIYVE
jgi:hypothetical protein